MPKTPRSSFRPPTPNPTESISFRSTQAGKPITANSPALATTAGTSISSAQPSPSVAWPEAIFTSVEIPATANIFETRNPPLPDYFPDTAFTLRTNAAYLAPAHRLIFSSFRMPPYPIFKNTTTSSPLATPSSLHGLIARHIPSRKLLPFTPNSISPKKPHSFFS